MASNASLSVGVLFGRLTALVAISCLLQIPHAAAGGSSTLDSGGPLAASFDDAEIVDVDPGEAGSMTCGLQEALARCIGGASCILQLRSDTTCSLPARITWDSSCAFETNGTDDLWIRGGGPSSVLDFANAHAGETAGNTLFDEMLCIEDGSSNIVISDFTLRHSDSCTSGCTLGYGMGINVSDRVEDVRVEQMSWISTQLPTSDLTAPNVFFLRALATGTPAIDHTPKRVSIANNHLSGGSAGVIHMLHCEDCSISSNVFDFNGVQEDANPSGTVRAIGIFGGTGYVVTNNVIDLRTDGHAILRWTSGILLAQAQGASALPQERINSGAVITGNVVRGMRAERHTGILIQGYNYASISDNTFSAGVCASDPLKSCSDCSECGTGECIAAPSKGIWFESTVIQAGAVGNIDNLVTHNTFTRMSPPGCPAAFNLNSGSPLSGKHNSIVGNTFELEPATLTGYCGEPSVYSANLWVGNRVVDVVDGCTAAGEATPAMSTPEMNSATPVSPR